MANRILTELNNLPKDPNPNQMYDFVTNVGPALHGGFDNGDFTGPQMESFSGMLAGIGYDLRNKKQTQNKNKQTKRKGHKAHKQT